FSDKIVDSEEGTELHAILADLARREGSVQEALGEYERFYRGASVRPVEQAYVQQQVQRLVQGLPPREQQAAQRRFGIEPAAVPGPGRGRGGGGRAGGRGGHRRLALARRGPAHRAGGGEVRAAGD